MKTYALKTLLILFFLLLFKTLSLNATDLLYKDDALILHRDATIYSFATPTQKWSSWKLHSLVNDICYNATGHLWAATKRGIAQLRDTTWTIHTLTTTTSNPTMPNDDIKTILYGNNTMPTLAGTRLGVQQFTGDSVWVQRDPDSPVHAYTITALQYVSDSTVLIGTDHGVFITTGKNGTIVAASSGLTGIYIKSFFYGPDSTTYAISYDYNQQHSSNIQGFINQFTDTTWSSKPFKGIFTDITSTPKEFLLLTRTAQKSYIYSLKGIFAYTLLGSLPFATTSIVASSSAHIYIGAKSGLYKHTPHTPQRTQQVAQNKVMACGTVGTTNWYLASHGYRKLVPYLQTATGWQQTPSIFPCNTIITQKTIGDRVWIGTDTGILISDGTTWSYLPFMHAAISQEITCISGHLQNIWIGTRKGIIHRAGEVHRFFYNTGLRVATTKRIGSTREDLWAEATGWHTYHNNTWTALNETFTYAETGEKLDQIYTDTTGTTWLYSATHGCINKCNGIEHVTPFKSGRDVITSHAAHLPPSPLWAHNTSGTWLIDNAHWCLSLYGNDKTWKTFKHTPTKLINDNQGRIWFSDCNSINAIEKDSIITFQLPPHLAPKNIVAVPGKGIWITAGKNLLQLQNNRFTVYPLPEKGHQRPSYTWVSLPHDKMTTALTTRNNTIYAGNATGLFAIDSLFSVTPIHTQAVTCMGKSNDATLWTAHGKGVTGYTSTGKILHAGIHTGLISNIITGIVPLNGETWFLSLLGASSLQQKRWTNHTRFGSITSPYLHCATTGYADALFLGTEQGILSSQQSTWVQLTTQCGLPSDTIYTLTTAHKTDIWAGTPAGVSLLKDGVVVKNFPQLTCAPGSILTTTPQGIVWLLRKNKHGFGQLYYFDGTAWKSDHPKRRISCLTVSDTGTIYAGASGGFYIIPPTP